MQEEESVIGVRGSIENAKPQTQKRKFYELEIVIIFLPTCVLGAQKNHLIETALFEYPQHMFWMRNKRSFPIHTLIWRPGSLNIRIIV